MGATTTLTTSIGVITQHTNTGTSDNLLFIAIPIIVAIIALALSPLAFKRIHSNHGANVVEVNKITLVSVVSVIISALCILFFLGNAQPASAASDNISINDHIDLVLDENNDVANADAKITNGTGEIYSLDSIRVISNNESINSDLWNITIVEKGYDIYDGNADSKNDISNVLQPNQSVTICISLQLSGDEENILSENIASLEIATKPTNVSAYYINRDGKKSNNINFNFDFAEYENADNTMANRKLATVASLLTTKMYADEQIVVQGQTYEIDKKTALEKALGFEDNYYYSMWNKIEQHDPGIIIDQKEFTQDPNDTTSYEFAHKKIFFGDHYSEIVSVNIAGTQCNPEWISNLDFGADTPNYWGDPKEPHDDWRNMNNHKGFDVAASRVKDALNQYLNKYVQNDANTKRIIFITGHSRGAGIANIVGKDFEDLANAKTFTYTFASPNTTYSDVSNLEYKTIFNFLNKDDVVCQIPCAKVGSFHRYGKDIPISILNDNSIIGGKLKDSFLSIMMDQYDGNDPQAISELTQSIKDKVLKGNRVQCYEIDIEHFPQVYDSCVHDDVSKDLTEDQANAILNDITNELTEKGLFKYCKLEKKEMADNPGRFEIIRWYNPAFLIKDISNNIADLKGFYDYGEGVNELILEVIPLVFKVYDGHIPMSYVVLATNAIY